MGFDWLVDFYHLSNVTNQRGDCMRYSIQAHGKQVVANTPGEALSIAANMVYLSHKLHSHLLAQIIRGEPATYAYGFAECSITPMN
jgi:hypothetical protein